MSHKAIANALSQIDKSVKKQAKARKRRIAKRCNKYKSATRLNEWRLLFDPGLGDLDVDTVSTLGLGLFPR